MATLDDSLRGTLAILGAGHAPPNAVSRNGRVLPDVATDGKAVIGGAIDQVGMSGIEVAVRIAGPDGTQTLVPARASAAVSLDDPQVKGIHMSRLFLPLQSKLADRSFDLPLVIELLHDFVASHKEMSSSSHLSIDFEYMLRRFALISEHSAWRSYPVGVSGWLKNGKITMRLRVRVAYSSTCPCSAALARQLLRERFCQDFPLETAIDVASVMDWLETDDSLIPTPHSQRSFADITVTLADPANAPGFDELIEMVEGAVETAVQGAVKRVDEQEFARLNGENLMFCEDSARRIKSALDRETRITDYRIIASHHESLHPHDAVAIVTKGVPGGLSAER